MIRFQCPHCRGIIAAGEWEPGAATECAYCAKIVEMPAERLSPGAVLGDFLLVRKLGAGGMGVVYLAHQLSLDRPAAIKILNSEFSQEAESVQAFIREARSAAKINHPNIVQAYAVGEEDGIFFFAMEFLDGKTMKEVLKTEKKIDPRQAANIVLQVAEALDCAWREQKLIHRDIKPDNIMQCANERIKLADLGLSGTFGDDANDDSEEVVGTPQYISPEQLTGVVTDTRSDIYSLGATFYHLVTGQFPYNGENTEEIAKQHVYGKLVPPRQVNDQLPPELDAVIVKMMARNPADRYQNCSELASALKDFLSKKDAGNNSSTAAAGAKLSGGLSGNVGVQPKIVIPTSGTKISIKTDKAEESKQSTSTAAPGSATAVEAPAENAKIEENKKSEPAPVPAAAPKITLNRAPGSGGAAKSSDKESSAAEAGKKTAEQTEEKKQSAEEKAAAGAGKKAAEETAGKTIDSSAAKAENVESTEEEKNESAEKKNTKSSAGKWIALIIVILLAAVGGGGYFYWHKFMRKPAEKTAKEADPKDNMTIAERMLATNRAAAAAVKTNVPAVPVVNNTTSTAAPAPVLSAFMREAKRLEQLSLSSERAFLQSWKSAHTRLKPNNAEEKKLFDTLENSYLDIDERLNVLPKRAPLLDRYEKTVAALARQADNREYIQRIKEAETRAFQLAESSPEAYKNDLARKMSLLDYAMITSARTRRPADWAKFQQALALAKAEVDRVAGRAGFEETAQELAEYAVRLGIAAEQGRSFTEVLRKNALRRKKVTTAQGSVTVLAATLTQLQLSVLENPEPAPAPKVKAPAKGKKKAAKGKKSKPAPRKTVKPKPKTEKLDLINGNVAVNKQWVEVLESALGKSDQYFYYMLYNGHLKQRLSDIAPDEYWRKRVDRIARGYFRCRLNLARPAELAALKKEFGSWQSFQNALKEFEAEQK